MRVSRAWAPPRSRRPRQARAAGRGCPASGAIAAVSAIGYLGSFTGPRLVGAVAEVTTLRVGLGLLVAVSPLIVVVAPLSLNQRNDASRRRPGARP